MNYFQREQPCKGIFACIRYVLTDIQLKALRK